MLCSRVKQGKGSAGFGDYVETELWLAQRNSRQQQNAELPHVWYGTLYQNVCVHHIIRLFSLLQSCPSELNDMLSSLQSKVINCRYGVLFWVWGDIKSKCESWLFRGDATFYWQRLVGCEGQRCNESGHDMGCIQICIWAPTLEHQGSA